VVTTSKRKLEKKSFSTQIKEERADLGARACFPWKKETIDESDDDDDNENMILKSGEEIVEGSH